MGGCRFFAAVIAVLAGALIAPPVASADFHFIKVREIFAGGAANSSYVMLQMYAAGQGNVAPFHHVDVYGPTGNSITTFTFANDAAIEQNQSTILVADTGYATAFPDGPEPDALHSDLNIPEAGGAVCFDSPDCVSWGSFSGNSSIPSSAGTPASPGGVTAGLALHRRISGGNCANQLDAADDTNDSSADFIEQSPNPRSNESPIDEGSVCIPPSTPETSIDGGPPNPTNETDATFTFSASPSDADTEFQCRLDNEATFTDCLSPKQYSSLGEGEHTVRVRATHPVDGTDQTPATRSWRVDLTPPTVTIDGAPDDPSHGGSATFDYTSDEPGATFECSLDFEEFKSEGCDATGITYNDLADGEHTFEVRATDPAGNEGSAATYTWTVDNSLVDTTPPETSIDSAPPNPSDSSTATFEYSSNELDSTFQCKLDDGLFADCPAAGITYTGLTNGAHTFQVRAIDPDGNVDPTPAGYTFDVSVFISEPTDDPSPPASDDSDPPSEPTAEPVVAGTAFAAGIAQARGAVALLRTRCRGQQGARCRGALRLILRVRVGRGNRKRVRNIVIGRARYNLPAGRPLRVVRIRLTRQGRQLLRRAGRRGLRVRLVGSRARSRVVALRPAKQRASRRHGGRARKRGARR